MREWVIDEGLSYEYFAPPVEGIVPTFLRSRSNGYWVGSRDRRLRLLEAALLHGFLPSSIIWPGRPAAFAMLGNTMSACVLQRLFVRLVGVLGVHLPDPWESGAAQASLLGFARAPSPLRTFHFRARRGVRPSASSAPSSASRPAPRLQAPCPPVSPIRPSGHEQPALSQSIRSPAPYGAAPPCRDALLRLPCFALAADLPSLRPSFLFGYLFGEEYTRSEHHFWRLINTQRES